MRYAVDTQLLVAAIRDDGARTELREFYGRAHSVLSVSAVVAQELLAGARTRDPAEPEEELIRPFRARGHLFTPSFAAWERSGQCIAELHRRHRIDARSVTKAFANDVLLAASCAEERIVLVTRNTRDFALISEEIPFRFVEPWP